MRRFMASFFALALLVCCVLPALAENSAEAKTIRIIATSDLHGKFMPWDYALNAASPSGSMTQLSTAIAQYRTGATLLVDAGDTIQDNSADIFIGNGKTHPMIQALNALNYDVWVTGNHEYNYGMDVLKQTIAEMKPKVLTGNVLDSAGEPIADGYAIFDVDGVRVCVIGMVTPNIARWDAVNLADCTVNDPLAATRAIIDVVQGQYDVLVGVFHMGIENEYGAANSGVTDILNACPEFDVMVSSHEHVLIPSMEINGALVVQNKFQAQTMAVIDLTLEKNGDGWKVVGRTAGSVAIAGFEADPTLTEMLTPYHEIACADAGQVVGVLEGGALAAENEISAIPTAQIEDTALIDLINDVQMHYTGAPVSASALLTMDANMGQGDIRKCDMAMVYRFTNTLYKLHMNGAQFRKYMEWSVAYYNTWQPGDLTISFNPEIRIFNYYMFAGVNYEINIANEPGSRIENLTWPDGAPVADDDEFDIAVNNYCAVSQLLAPGVIYEEGDMPTLLEIDVRGDIGGVRELIRDYIVNVKGGTITPECDGNWRITGNDWDSGLHRRAVELLTEGKLSIPASEGGTPNAKAITEEDVLGCLEEPGDVLFTATAEYGNWKKQGKDLPL